MNTTTIREIESLTIKEIEELRADGKVELLKIKEHACYLVDLEGYFGYSVLVFKNNHHIHYANDYELHHRNKTVKELKEWYIETLNNKLFTETELMEEVQTYNEYERKSYYVRNYWIMQYDHISIFGIGKDSEEKKKAKEKMFYCHDCFCYVSENIIVKTASEFMNHIEKSFANVKNNEEVFRKMVSYELANHEACMTCDYMDALDAIGMKFEDLTEEQKRIVKEELKKQIDNYC